MIDPLILLARVGFDEILADIGGPTDPAWADEDDQAAMDAAAEVARLSDHIRVRDALIDTKPRPRGANSSGVQWVRPITWPDRMPGFVTWSGQMTLEKTVKKWQAEIKKATDLYTHTVYAVGSSGFDPLTTQSALDIGFSPAALLMPIQQRPGLELLAIVGLETLPLVSWPRRKSHVRECGFILDGIVYRMPVEHREHYYYRWGWATETREIAPDYSIPPDVPQEIEE